MAKAASTTFCTFSSSNPSFNSPSKPLITIQTPSFLKLPTTYSTKCRTQFLTSNNNNPHSSLTPIKSSSSSSSSSSNAAFHGLCYVVRDNIDTDQIIPAEYLTLVPSNPEEYKKLGSYALIGLPTSYPVRFVEENEVQTKYSIIIAGANFGCGSSREHAPVALGAAGTKAIVAESYARIFFRNSVSTGEVYPLESEVRICDEISTGDVATVELDGSKLINHTTGKEYALKSIGDAGPVIEAGGIFAYARKAGMIAAAGTS